MGDLFSILKQAQQKTGLSEHYCKSLLKRIQLRHEIGGFEKYFEINGFLQIKNRRGNKYLFDNFQTKNF